MSILAILILMMTGCSDTPAPTQVTEDGIQIVELKNNTASQNSGCINVVFTVIHTNTSPFTAIGEVTGDLEGTVNLKAELPIAFNGKTISWSGFAEWSITGGKIPGLNNFVTTINNRNLAVDRPGSPAHIFENIGEMRAISGVKKANLRYQGTFDAQIQTAVWEFRGVICK
jgi:hypothetical protein